MWTENIPFLMFLRKNKDFEGKLGYSAHLRKKTAKKHFHIWNFNAPYVY